VQRYAIDYAPSSIGFCSPEATNACADVALSKLEVCFVSANSVIDGASMVVANGFSNEKNL